MKNQVVIDESNPDNAGCQPGFGFSRPSYVSYRDYTITIRKLTVQREAQDVPDLQYRKFGGCGAVCS